MRDHLDARTKIEPYYWDVNKNSEFPNPKEKPDRALALFKPLSGFFAGLKPFATVKL